LAVVGLLVALSLLALGGLPMKSTAVSKNPTTPESGLVVFVGSHSGFAGETLASLEPYFRGPTLEVTELANLSAVATRVNGSSIVIFNSDWLKGMGGAAALTDFFKTILPSQVKIVALGGPTSLLFDALKQARDGIFSEGRNPAYDNPPLAGYKLKRVTGPDGAPYYGDSFLMGYTETAFDAADAIASWR
jgi:hypothetical protein